jgi:hypothetical protein
VLRRPIETAALTGQVPSMAKADRQISGEPASSEPSRRGIVASRFTAQGCFKSAPSISRAIRWQLDRLRVPRSEAALYGLRIEKQSDRPIIG